MPTNLQDFSAVLSSILGILGLFLLGYIILMGWAYQSGRNTCFAKIIEKYRKDQKPIVKLLSTSSKGELPWQDPALIHGGMTALRVIAILFGYVVMMSIFASLDETMTTNELIRAMSIFMIYPIVMISIFVIMVAAIFSLRQNVFRPFEFAGSLFSPILIGSGAAVLSYYLINVIKESVPLLASQILLLVVVSMCISYLYGVIESFKDANIEERFPLVEVITLHQKIAQLRLYEKTDTDYRFIGEDGINHIIPTANIIEIRHLSITNIDASNPSPQTIQQPQKEHKTK